MVCYAVVTLAKLRCHESGVTRRQQQLRALAAEGFFFAAAAPEQQLLSSGLAAACRLLRRTFFAASCLLLLQKLLLSFGRRELWPRSTYASLGCRDGRYLSDREGQQHHRNK